MKSHKNAIDDLTKKFLKRKKLRRSFNPYSYDDAITMSGNNYQKRKQMVNPLPVNSYEKTNRNSKINMPPDVAEAKNFYDDDDTPISPETVDYRGGMYKYAEL